MKLFRHVRSRVVRERRPASFPRRRLLGPGVAALIVAAFCCVPTGSCWAVQTLAVHETVLPGSTPTPDLKVEPRKRLRERRIQRVWWNQPRFVKALGLRPEQRKKMDGVLLDRMKNRRALLAEERKARNAFHLALTSGDWAGAQARATELRQAAAAESDARSRVRIEVFQLLDVGQRVSVVKNYPRLIGRPWLPGYARRTPLHMRRNPARRRRIEGR